jgi:MerR family redox-sensitive transcriptional activator SoxR
MHQPTIPPMMSIGEVAKRAGVAASALRYYEREGLIPKADRRGGKRVYGADILDRLALIGVAKGAGFTVAEIQTLLSGDPRIGTAP